MAYAILQCIHMAVGSGATGVAWAAPLLKAREAWSLIHYVRAGVSLYRLKIDPNFTVLCVATIFLIAACPLLFDRWLLHPS